MKNTVYPFLPKLETPRCDPFTKVSQQGSQGFGTKAGSTSELDSIWDVCASRGYEVIKIIGCGKNAQVAKAFCHKTQTYVAIKMIRGSEVTDYAKLRTYREVYTMQSLSRIQDSNHGSCPKLIESFTGKRGLDPLFLVMELFQQDLKTLSTTTALDPSAKKRLVYDMICSVKFMHSSNLIHRDIKPANFLISDQGKVVLADYG